MWEKLSITRQHQCMGTNALIKNHTQPRYIHDRFPGSVFKVNKIGKSDRDAIKERQVMATMNDKRIVDVFGSYFSPEKEKDMFIMINELCEYGNLFDYIQRIRPSEVEIPEEVIFLILVDLVEAIAYINS